MRGLILGVNTYLVHKFLLVLEDICGVESVKNTLRHADAAEIANTLYVSMHRHVFAIDMFTSQHKTYNVFISAASACRRVFLNGNKRCLP